MPYISLPYVSNLKANGSVVPKIRTYVVPKVIQISLYPSSLQHSLIQPFPTSNATKFALSIMLYTAHFVLKFGWISIKIESYSLKLVDKSFEKYVTPPVRWTETFFRHSPTIKVFHFKALK